MVALIDGLDLLLITAIFVLIAFLIAVRDTFSVFALILNVSIAGLRPFGFLADIVESTIIAGCNAGIAALGTAAGDLWAGLVWTTQNAINGIANLAGSIHSMLKHLWNSGIPAYVKSITVPIVTSVKAVANDLSNLGGYVHTQVTRLDNKIDGSISALKTKLEGELVSAVSTVETDLHNAINTLKAVVEGDITNAIATAETHAQSALDIVQKAENAAIAAVDRAEDATAKQLKDYIASVPLTDLEALLTAVPLLATLVSVTFAETGLDNELCRSKFKGVCGTGATQWFQFLEGLLLVDTALSLRGVIEMAQEVAHEALPIVRELVA